MAGGEGISLTFLSSALTQRSAERYSPLRRPKLHTFRGRHSHADGLQVVYLIRRFSSRRQ